MTGCDLPATTRRGRSSRAARDVLRDELVTVVIPELVALQHRLLEVPGACRGEDEQRYQQRQERRAV
jgi:hypothetical protein